MWAFGNGVIILQNDYIVSGSCLWHWLAGGGQIITGPGNTPTVTLATSPAFTNSFAQAFDLGLIKIQVNFNGSAALGTQQYNVILNGVIDAHGNCALFPGNVAGSTATGGQCD
jgi:hypothetical protein